jgi:hypothetical protein
MADILRRLRDPDPNWSEYDIGDLVVEAADEIEMLRAFARRVYRSESSPAWAHDAAAKVLDLPSLAHGCDGTEEGG